MDLSNKPLDRWLCAEPLESRWLLSGGTPSSPEHDAAGAAAVVVLELGAAEEEGDDESSVAPDELPAPVLAAFHAAFPNAEIEEAQREVDDGATEYNIEAELDGRELDISLNPTGRIIEVEESVAPSELPDAVLAWLRQQFGDDASIAEASIVNDAGTVKYELSFTPAGDVPMEATLGVAEGEPLAVVPPPLALQEIFEAAGETAVDAAESLIPADSEPLVQAQHPSAAADSAQPAKVDAPVKTIAATAAPGVATILNVISKPTAGAMQALAAGIGASVWLPQAADVVQDVASINIAAVEQRVQGLLDDIESLTKKVAATETVGRRAMPIAIVAAAAIIAAAQLAIIRLRLPKGGPVLVFNALNSSWSWVLGNCGSERQR